MKDQKQPKMSGEARESLKLLSEFEEGLQIDKNELDDALEEQPDIFYRVAREYASAVSFRDGAKLHMDDLSAELDEIVREELEAEHEKQEKKGRVTEGAVKSAIHRRDEMIEANAAWIQWKSIADRWAALQEAFKQRSHALAHLVSLYSAGYYGHMTGVGASGRMKDRRAEEGRTAMAERRRREAGVDD